MVRVASRLIVLTLFLTLFAFLLLNMLAYSHAESMLRYVPEGDRTAPPERLTPPERLRVLLRGVVVPRPTGEQTPADHGLAFESLRIPLVGGSHLGAWHCPCEGADTLVVLFHGYAAEKSSLLAEASLLHRLGCATLLVDFRGSGESSEDYTTLGYIEAEDVDAVMRFLRREPDHLRREPDHLRSEQDHRRLVLLGRSMGGAAVLYAVHSYGVQPDALILESVFPTLLGTVRNRFAALGVPAFPSAELLVFWGGRHMGFDGFRHDPEEYARRVRCPSLFLCGKGDQRVRPGEARRVYAAAAGPKRLLELPSSGHGSLATEATEAWRRAVGTFLMTLED